MFVDINMHLFVYAYMCMYHYDLILIHPNRKFKGFRLIFIQGYSAHPLNKLRPHFISEIQI